MPLLRRPTASPETIADPEDAAANPDPRHTPGKGRPTPKRQSARQNRRQPIPKDRREAEKLRRARNRELRRTQRQALMTGDERNLPARDAGPARRLARDLVDERFTVGQFAIGLILVLFLLSTSQNQVLGLIVRLVLLVLAVAIVAQGYAVGRSAKATVVERHGEAAGQGITMYVFWRALSARRMRRPPAMVKRTRLF